MTQILELAVKDFRNILKHSSDFTVKDGIVDERMGYIRSDLEPQQEKKWEFQN